MILNRETLFSIILISFTSNLFPQTYKNSKVLMSELGVVKMTEHLGSDTLGSGGSVSIFENGKLVELRRTFAKVTRIQRNNYKEDGSLQNQTFLKGTKIEKSYYYEQFVDSTLVYEVTGNDTILSRTNYYCDSLLCESKEYRYGRRTKYFYENRKPLKTKFFNESGNLVSIQIFEYNENGNLKMDQTKAADGGYFIQHTYLYGFGEESPKVEEFLSTDDRGTFWTYFIYEYYESGLIKKISNLDEDSGLYLQSSFKYSFEK